MHDMSMLLGYLIGHPSILVFIGTIAFIVLKDRLSGTYITIKEFKDTMQNYTNTKDIANLTIGNQKCEEYRTNIDKTFIDIKQLLCQIGSKTDKLYDMLYEHVKDEARK